MINIRSGKMLKRIFFIILFYSILTFPQDSLFFNADYIPHTDTTLIFKPANYNSSNAYPLLFMLHGWSGNYAQWSRIANLQHYADADSFIIVCPDGFYDSWYINSPVRKNSQFEKFFFKNLVPGIFKKYNIDKKNIFITGLSMGGHGAMYLFLKHPDFFKSAGSTSGILDITAFPKNWELPEYLGPMKSDSALWKKYSDIYLLKNIANWKMPILVDCGKDDFSYNVNLNFVHKCKQLNIPLVFLTGSGNHSYKYWEKSIIKHFEFFKILSKVKNTAEESHK